jgi:hypothetical protein
VAAYTFGLQEVLQSVDATLVFSRHKDVKSASVDGDPKCGHFAAELLQKRIHTGEIDGRSPRIRPLRVNTAAANPRRTFGEVFSCGVPEDSDATIQQCNFGPTFVRCPRIVWPFILDRRLLRGRLLDRKSLS